MAEDTYPSFDQNVIDQALEAAQRHADTLKTTTGGGQIEAVNGTLKLGAQCISVTIQNGQACLNVPIAGSVCLPVPSWVPDGTAAQACLDICTVFGVPCGVEVTVSVAGQTVVSQHWGCSC